ncbi:DUF4430 domain-containing protein [Fundicoccus culcitae]|uniref:DUF4430 domain-containing protein n=1 Tax=Fundicoccus culcitae TaxID=2969821 RepID=A0ABY5P9L3_9LACT|nr:DUF4430 domain-containing protein [Fundicoccus culcitae]UUX35150.1 DUF4430 domain-containing protein [Fundicoccus culcitae]
MKKLVQMMVTLLMVSFFNVTVMAEEDMATFEGEGTTETQVDFRIVTVEGEVFFEDEVLLIDDTPTVLDALSAAIDFAELDYFPSGDAEGDDNIYRGEIEGLASDDPYFWMAFINGEATETNVARQEISDGDLVELIYGDVEQGYVEVPRQAVVYQGEGDTETRVQLLVRTTENEVLFNDEVLIIDDAPTAYQALVAAAEAQDLELAVNGDDENMFLEGIEDLISENPNFWMIYVNGEPAEVGMAVLEVDEDDLVEYVYGDYSLGYVEFEEE